jgi:hypothetical protein
MALPRLYAYALTAVTGALVVAGWVLLTVSPSGGDVVYLQTAVAVGGLSTALGVVIARRQPANVVGALLVWIGFDVVFLATREVYWSILHRRPSVPAVGDWLVAAVKESGVWLLVAAALLLLYFPDGRLPGSRWRWVPVVLVVDAVAFQAFGAVDPTPTPYAPEPVPTPFGVAPDTVLLVDGLATVPLLMVLTVACATSLIVKYRRADAALRTQLKWLALAGLGLPVTLIGCWLEYVLLGNAYWFSFAAMVVLLVGVPAATAIAVLRHDLYDIDKAIAATVTYTAVTVVLLGFYAVASFVVGLAAGRASPVAAHLRPGTGLAGLTDRVAAAGGALLLHSPSGYGTLVQAVLPCAS